MASASLRQRSATYKYPVGMLRSAQSADACGGNRLVRSVPADWPARCPTPTPVPNREPMPLGRRAEHAWIADSVQAGRRVPLRCAAREPARPRCRLAGLCMRVVGIAAPPARARRSSRVAAPDHCTPPSAACRSHCCALCGYLGRTPSKGTGRAPTRMVGRGHVPTPGPQ